MKKITLYQLILLINVIWAVVVLEAINMWVFGIDSGILIIAIAAICLAAGIPIGALIKGVEVK